MAELRKEVDDQGVLEAVSRVPREDFVPREYASASYENAPLPIGEGQPISQPLMVALMLQGLALKPTDRVLEVGTGSGYQVALLSRLAKEVVTVERLPTLERRARALLRGLGYENVTVLPAGPDLGCPDRGPYDAIVVAAAAPSVPPGLVGQLTLGGRMIVPVGTRTEQPLVRVVRRPNGTEASSLGPCRFVPLIGPGAWPQRTHGTNGGPPTDSVQ